MKVKDAIRKLKKIDPERQIFVHISDETYEPMAIVQSVTLKETNPPMGGRYTEVEDDNYKDSFEVVIFAQQVAEPDLEKLGFCLKCGTRPCTCEEKYGEEKAG